MSVERQQGKWYQLRLFEGKEDQVRHGAGGEGGTGPAAPEEWQALTALERERALTRDLRKVRYVATVEETAGHDEYVRWCGRTGTVRSRPTR